jgi:hypothetical protein
MKKSLILALLVVTSLVTIAQQRKVDSLVLQMTSDTARVFHSLRLLQENLNMKTETGKTLYENIVSPFLGNAKFVPNPEFVGTKSKEIVKPKDNKLNLKFK